MIAHSIESCSVTDLCTTLSMSRMQLHRRLEVAGLPQAKALLTMFRFLYVLRLRRQEWSAEAIAGLLHFGDARELYRWLSRQELTPKISYAEAIRLVAGQVSRPLLQGVRERNTVRFQDTLRDHAEAALRVDTAV